MVNYYSVNIDNKQRFYHIFTKKGNGKENLWHENINRSYDLVINDYEVWQIFFDSQRSPFRLL